MKNRKHIISILVAAVLLLSLAAPALADGAADAETGALGECVDEWSAKLLDGALLAGSSFWTGSDLRTEYRLTLAPGSMAVPVAVSGDPLRTRQSLAEAAAALEADGWHVLGGVNGGFYTVATGEPVGLTVGGGQLEHDDEGGLWAVGFRADGSAIFGSPALSLTLLAEETTYPVAGWNRLAKEGFSAFTPDCADALRFPEHTLCVLFDAPALPGLSGEAALEVDIIFESDGSDVAIPEGKLLLTLPPVEQKNEETDKTETVAAALPEDFAEGAAFTLEARCAEGWADVDSAVGILYPRVEDGAVLPGLSAAAEPRTAIGLCADGTLILYALDGRQSGYSGGGGLTHVAKRMVELGCVTAGALDGGGSTQLAAFLPGDGGVRIFNSPSAGTPRSVSNYILFAVRAEPTGVATQLSMEPLHINALAGAAVPLTVRAADDAGYGAQAPARLTFSVSDCLGEVRDGQYFAAGDGSGAVTVSAPGVEGVSIPVRVVASPDAIVLYGEKYGKETRSLTLEPGYEVDLRARAWDRHIPLSCNDLCFTWTLDEAVGTVDETGHIVPGDVSATGLLTVSAGESQTQIPITVWTGVPFRDVSRYHRFFDAIKYVYDNEIFIGTAADRFDPDVVMTRGMLVTVLWRMEGEPEASAPASFADVHPGDWYADAVAWAAETGIVNGYSPERFGPKDDLTREQILTILHRWAGLPEAPEGEDANAWPEESDAHDWSLAAMRWASAAELFAWDWEGAPSAREPMDRAHVADVLTRYETVWKPKLSEMPESPQK